MAQVLAGARGSDIHRLVGRPCAQVDDWPAGAGGEPALKVQEERTRGLRAALPDALALGQGRDERLPRIAVWSLGVKRHQSPLTFAPGQINVLRVGEKRIRLVSVFGERNGRPRVHQQHGVTEHGAEGGRDPLAAGAEHQIIGRQHAGPKVWERPQFRRPRRCACAAVGPRPGTGPTSARHERCCRQGSRRTRCGHASPSR